MCRYAKEVCDAVVAKCLTGRPKTVEKAQAIFMLWVELEAVEAFLVRRFFYPGVCFYLEIVTEVHVSLSLSQFFFLHLLVS